MSFDKKVRVYSKDDLTEKFGKGYKVEHANPRFFAAPKHSVDFVMTTNKTIADAYQAKGIPRIYFNEDGEVVTGDGVDEQLTKQTPEQITKQTPEQRPEHIAEAVDTEEPVSTDTEEPVQPPYEETEDASEEDASEEETQESASEEGEIDLEKMSAAQVKEYASRNLGGEFKTKKEAVEALEKVKGVGSKLTV